jgi:hypothetical protein
MENARTSEEGAKLAPRNLGPHVTKATVTTTYLKNMQIVEYVISMSHPIRKRTLYTLAVYFDCLA